MEKIQTEERQEPKQQSRLSILSYNLKTVYLFTASDLKTTLFPAATFALASTLSGPLLNIDLGASPFWTILSRLPHSILWTWLHLWVFNLANQRLPNSILEDAINKPWRPLPSKRLSATQARQLLLASIPAVVLLSAFYLGGRDPSLVLLVLTWLYNDLGASDEHFLVRHATNALGFTSFSAGATQAILYHSSPLPAALYYWLAMIAVVITFTIQFQDMEDQEGDRLRDRLTMPIVLGDNVTRWGNAATILAFSLLAAKFWDLALPLYLLPGLLGAAIAARTLLLKSLKADKQTFKLWCLWLMLLYLLPLIKRYSFLVGV